MKKIGARPHLGKYCESYGRTDFEQLHGENFSRFWQQPLLWGAVAFLELGQAWFAAAEPGGPPATARALLFDGSGAPRAAFLSLVVRLALLAAFSLLLYLNLFVFLNYLNVCTPLERVACNFAVSLSIKTHSSPPKNHKHHNTKPQIYHIFLH